jgi:ubiquinone/menaquinone biosynthesis C-methylase UbiE
MIARLYERLMLPRLVQLACGTRPIARQRAVWMPKARGAVLEVGFGSGLNVPHYAPRRITRLVGLEPSDGMARLAERRRPVAPFPIRLLAASAESIPLEADSMDTAVISWTLCSVESPENALAEIRRVLKPGGRLVFCEHGAAPDASVRRWQDRLTPAWSRLAGGCCLNRDAPVLIRGAGFQIVELEAKYLPGWKPAAWNTAGVARKR